MSTGQIFFVVGIVGMIASAVAAVLSARILRRQEKKLKEHHFLRCSNCYLVNPRYIRGISGYTVTMWDGSELMISHPKRKQFMQELTAYMGEGNL